jgi:hypothetical protein
LEVLIQQSLRHIHALKLLRKREAVVSAMDAEEGIADVL